MTNDNIHQPVLVRQRFYAAAHKKITTMIEDITITYTTPSSDLTHRIACPLSDDNCPYNLAELAAHLIKASNANPDIVIQQLIQEFCPDNIRVGRKDNP